MPMGRRNNCACAHLAIATFVSGPLSRENPFNTRIQEFQSRTSIDTPEFLAKAFQEVLINWTGFKSKIQAKKRDKQLHRGNTLVSQGV